MEFGGPVWHASIGQFGRPVIDAATWFAVAEQCLHGVGDAGLGEWREVGDVAVHLRRRLAPREQIGVGDVCDLRRSNEGRRRLFRAKQWMDVRLWPFAEGEVT
jgi:hypothetical protein